MKSLINLRKVFYLLTLSLVVAALTSGCKSPSSSATQTQHAASTVNDGANTAVWSIGKNDNSGTELALGPADYKKFLERDFGYEDRYYLIGHSQPKADFPYVLPGPDDTWGGTWGTSGWRTHEINILFGVKEITAKGRWNLVVDLVDSNPSKSLLKVSVNDQDHKFLLKGVSDKSLTETPATDTTERVINIPIQDGVIRDGGNVIRLTVLEGSWVVFDHVRLEGPEGVKLVAPKDAFIRSVAAATYELDV
ncbi:MAG TPA: polysaccharide lyase family protein, partial [Chryseosolibacter sp.]|nr:polysaccharide lyase family protein [Chryseosolibacter sp.]